MKSVFLSNLILLSKVGRPELYQRWNWLMKVHDRGHLPFTVQQLEKALGVDFNKKGDSK